MSDKPHLLHLFTAQSWASPFDVNMAYDAGFTAVTPYTGIDTAQIRALTQDAIFSRGPKGVRNTGIMIGGRDIEVALASFAAAREAMVPPFAASVLVDPSGAFTTAAAMVACVEQVLRDHASTSLDGLRVVVVGGTGPVGQTAGIIAAMQQARVTLLSSSSSAKAEQAAAFCREQFGVTIEGALAREPADLARQLADADVVLACAAAGIEVVSEAGLRAARQLKVAADVNAVPPAGIHGLDAMTNGDTLAGTSVRGIGALAIGNIKYQVESGLLKQMLASQEALYLSFPEAFELARQRVV